MSPMLRPGRPQRRPRPAGRRARPLRGLGRASDRQAEHDRVREQPGKPWDGDDYYTLPMKGFEGMLEPYLDSGAMMTSYVKPIKRAGKRVGVAAVDLSLKSLDARMKAVKVLDSGYAFVASDTGQLVAYPRQKGWAGKQDRRPDRLAASRSRPGRHPRRRQGGSLRTRRDGRPGQRQAGDPVLHAGEDQRWSFVAVAPKAEVLAGVNSLRTTLILIGALALLAGRHRRAVDRFAPEPPGGRGGSRRRADRRRRPRRGRPRPQPG